MSKLTKPGAILDMNSSGRNKMANEGHCRMCLRHKKVRPLTRHHLVPQSWFLARDPQGHFINSLEIRSLRNANANIVPLCRPCHDLVDNKTREERMAARTELRRSLVQIEIAFAERIRGMGWLDTNYPLIRGPRKIAVHAAGVESDGQIRATRREIRYPHVNSSGGYPRARVSDGQTG